METRANYILIGAFAIAGFIGILALFLWFARIELNRQFAYYDISFSSVSGLNKASDVRFGGLPVGRVVDVQLSPEADGSILVRVEIAADTPVRTDSIATIEAQGVTGVSFVGISQGTPTAPLSMAEAGGGIPKIEAGRSVLQSLSEDAPQLLKATLRVVEEVGDLLGGENQGRLDRILINIEGASDNFAQTLKDFSAVTGSVTSFASQIDRFNATLEELTNELTGVLATADTTIASIGELSEDAKTVLAAGTDTLVDVSGTAAETKRYIAENLTIATDELRQTVIDLRAEITAFSEDARGLMGTIGTTGTTATARLAEAEATLAALDVLLAQVKDTVVTFDGAAARFDTMIETQGTPLLAETRTAVAEARKAIQSINSVAETDLPVIVTDIRDATEAASKVISQVGSDLSAASAQIDDVIASAATTLVTVTDTFEKANVTLAAINDAMATGDRALSVAESAFAGAERVINEDVADITASLKTTLDELTGAIGKVSGDLPEITADLRAAGQSANAAFGELGRVAGVSGPAIESFTTTGLPLYTRLAQEIRNLIGNLERLTNTIQRDPARFLLDQQTPEFRR